MALLDGKVAIITGASKGIGRALSLRFAQEKAAVVCAARSADLVRETAELVGKAGGRAIAVTCDAAKEDDVRRMIAAGLEAFGKITQFRILWPGANDREDHVPPFAQDELSHAQKETVTLARVQGAYRRDERVAGRHR